MNDSNHDATVIDADLGYVGGQEVSGSVKLEAGLHPFRLFYARRTESKPLLSLSWSGPDIARQTVPGDVYQRAAGKEPESK